MAWNNVHPEAPIDDDGRPIHPERGHPICGYEKTDAVDPNGRKREDYPYCLLAAGWGTDRKTGHCSKHYGASTGAPEGWRNGSARHLLYSNRMSEDDREVFEAVVRDPDDDESLMSVDDMADMLRTSIGWEYTRLVRAVDHVPDAELVERFRCPNCGETHDGKTLDKDTKTSCGGDKRRPDGSFVPCEIPAERDAMVPKERFVTFGDKSFERKENHLANLIQAYKKVAEGSDVNITGSHDVTHRGDADAPIEVSITHAAIDLPEGEAVESPDADEGG